MEEQEDFYSTFVFLTHFFVSTTTSGKEFINLFQNSVCGLQDVNFNYPHILLQINNVVLAWEFCIFNILHDSLQKYTTLNSKKYQKPGKFI